MSARIENPPNFLFSLKVWYGTVTSKAWCIFSQCAFYIYQAHFLPSFWHSCFFLIWYLSLLCRTQYIIVYLLASMLSCAWLHSLLFLQFIICVFVYERCIVYKYFQSFATEVNELFNICSILNIIFCS